MVLSLTASPLSSPTQTRRLFNGSTNSDTASSALGKTVPATLPPAQDTLHFSGPSRNHVSAAELERGLHDAHDSFALRNAERHFGEYDLAQSIQDLNKTPQSQKLIRGVKVGWEGVKAGLGAFAVTTLITAIFALPAAGFTALAGCIPLMHWLWPIAAGIATMPLIIGGIAGGIRGLMALLKK